ncbi:MAG: zinc-dependent alcohol dehydrogenase family protein [Thermoguttaceae bacterium]|nr:zinc-dependent alcohol dehydrogenase family protein [Thermoguttaceae bacterium]MDW8078491.1 zinc-dependent alcohol dehydrogenase family protein [Thermoguttaceae bacterium]
MKAMVLPEIGPIESAPLKLRDLPVPQPGFGQLLVRVRVCAICRTDLHVVEGDLPRYRVPIIPGHQVVGVVEEIGENCRRFRPGDRVGIAWLRYTCGGCRLCQTGRENLCACARFTGYHEDGGFAEFTLVPEEFAYPIPPGFEDTDAAPLLCAGIIGYRALRRANVPEGGRLALFGFGSSAHVVLQIALHRGYEVYVVTRGEKHRQLAREMGAFWVGESPSQLPVRVDSAILFAPAGELVPAIMERLERGGTLAIAGIHVTPIPAMDYERCLFYERDLRSVTSNTREDGQQLLAEAAQIPIRPRVTCYPLVDANRALQDLKADRISGTGVLVVE